MAWQFNMKSIVEVCERLSSEVLRWTHESIVQAAKKQKKRGYVRKYNLNP